MFKFHQFNVKEGFQKLREIERLEWLCQLRPTHHCFPGGGNGNPLQYSYWDNSMDRGAWWAIVHEAAKSRTQLSNQAPTTLL